MKAMILAAGLGTRLLPFTRTTPKPLFSIAGRTLLDIHIDALQKAGCEAAIVNTHHLAGKIESHIAGRNYAIPVFTRFEPALLGTGGAIRNLENFWDHRPFMVINSDIVTDIDFSSVYAFHLSHPYPVTLVLHDHEEINTVSVNRSGFITGFNGRGISESTLQRTFTGIQVLDPEVLGLIPKSGRADSIDLYRELISAGEKIPAYEPKNVYWADIGTPRRYRETTLHQMVPQAFRNAFNTPCTGIVRHDPLAGDGSDRGWSRIFDDVRSLVLADHGIRKLSRQTEVDSFVAIGRHLSARGIPVPRIHLSDAVCGLVFVEDLGNTHLQAVVSGTENKDMIRGWYRRIIDGLITMSVNGYRHFDVSWTYQTPEYDREVIVENECRYFVDAFLNGYLNLGVRFSDFEGEFESLAATTLHHGVAGFMHRDFQSRNIMVKDDAFYFIDFQGGRIGPIQYDLASLLIDPYVALPDTLQGELSHYCAGKLHTLTGVDENRILRGYKYCRITRNLQILGAFGFLVRVKNKAHFEAYIADALRTLIRSLNDCDEKPLPRLTAILHDIARRPERFSGLT